MNQSQTKICQNCKTDFTIESDDFVFYEKMQVPVPNICGYCRIKQIMMFRNETTLYKRNCDLCAESMISMYNPNSPYTVYCNDCYKSDKWDAKNYAKDYDKIRPFMEQMKELLLIVPKQTLFISGGTNVKGEYQNFSGFNKKCYFVFNTGYTENCSYSRGLRYCRDVLDSYFAEQLEKSYECINAQNSYGICYSQNISNCLNSQFLFNCNNLQSCFGCVNLRNKNYHFLNKPLEKKEYIDKVSGILGSYDKIEKFWREFRDFKSNFSQRQNNNIKTVDSDGEYLLQSKNCHYCFEMINGEDCKFNFFTKSIKDSRDNVGYGYDCELNLATVAVGYSNKVIGSFSSHHCVNIEYCFDVERADDCFGCDGLRNAKCRILNKEYGKNEYKILRDQIVGQLKKSGQYGLYFPLEMAPFAYNETVALNMFPISN
ncbi:MAG: hypothetical protein US76_01380 [Parcubacteria group bacterium GW2011_GWA2_38_13b]|nr:MAG: hypothetical protein US76_01380 [Parcubacteria group bacterium GW2011_GWA2_38_13b]